MDFYSTSLSLSSVVAILVVALSLYLIRVGSPGNNKVGRSAPSIQRTSSRVKKRKKQKGDRLEGLSTETEAQDFERIVPGAIALDKVDNRTTPPLANVLDVVASVETGQAAKEKRKKANKPPLKPSAAAISGATLAGITSDLDGEQSGFFGQPRPRMQTVETDQGGSWIKVTRGRKSSSATANTNASTSTEVESSGVLSSHADGESNANKNTMPSTKRTMSAEKMISNESPNTADNPEEETRGPHVARTMTPRASHPKPTNPLENDSIGGTAQSDDDDGFAVVGRHRKRSQHLSNASSSSANAMKASETLTKKKRQNQAKAQREKSLKAEAERERLQRLAHHQNVLVNARLEDRIRGKRKEVEDSSRLIWDA